VRFVHGSCAASALAVYLATVVARVATLTRVAGAVIGVGGRGRGGVNPTQY